MKRDCQGLKLLQKTPGESFTAFVPHDLPPSPPLEMRSALRKELSHADQMVGRLDGLSTLIRHPELLINFYMRKEAVLSSQIEGTQSTLAELLLFEIEPDSGSDDTVMGSSESERDSL